MSPPLAWSSRQPDINIVAKEQVVVAGEKKVPRKKKKSVPKAKRGSKKSKPEEKSEEDTMDDAYIIFQYGQLSHVGQIKEIVGYR